MNAQGAIHQYLEDQHWLLDLGLSALDRAVAAHAFADAHERLAGVGAHLGRHVRTEERVLFPLYDRLPEVRPESTARMRDEHADLRRLIAALDLLLDREDADRGRAALSTLRSVLLVHGAKEDWMIYPRVVDALPASEQAELVRALRSE